MVIGSSPIIYPMWISFFKNNLNTSNKTCKLNEIISIRKIFQKYKNTNKNTTFANIKYYITLLSTLTNINASSFQFKNLVSTDLLQNIISSYLYYCSGVKKMKLQNLTSKQSKLTPTITIFKYKTQLYSSILKNYKLKKLITNGFFIKKLELEKSQKKSDKMNLLNLKESYNYINALNNTTENNFHIIVLKNTNTKFFKIINFFKKKISNQNVIIYFTPNINYSKKKFKKIKSIKRKLVKKYNKVVKN